MGKNQHRFPGEKGIVLYGYAVIYDTFNRCKKFSYQFTKMNVNKLIYTQKIPVGIEKVWDFFSNPRNLEKITPREMHMKITNREDIGTLYEGMVISYRLFPLFAFPVQWSTEIIHIDRPHEFEDEQKSGPYEVWRHKHLFREIPEGVEMTDIVEYRIPFGFLGQMLDQLLIHNRLEYVFSYRRKKIEEIFGAVQPVAT